MKQEEQEYLDEKNLKENDVINFSNGNRFYYGCVKTINKKLFVVLLNNSEEKFKLESCSHIKKVEGGKINMVEKEEKVKKEKKEKTPSITDARVENAKKVIAYMTNELHIEKKDFTKVLSRCYRLLGK
jgi:hypothetical protein